MTDVRANAPREVRLAVSTLDAAALQPYCVPGTPAERIAMVWPLTVEVLSPAGRPIQVTADLPGFWAGSWAAVRKDMISAYPKHDWPSDPAAATPTTRARRGR